MVPWNLRRFSEMILPVDSAVAEQWGRLFIRPPRPSIDGLLAATAAVHDLTIMTRATPPILSVAVLRFSIRLSFETSASVTELLKQGKGHLQYPDALRHLRDTCLEFLAKGLGGNHLHRGSPAE